MVTGPIDLQLEEDIGIWAEARRTLLETLGSATSPAMI